MKHKIWLRVPAKNKFMTTEPTSEPFSISLVDFEADVKDLTKSVWYIYRGIFFWSVKYSELRKLFGIILPWNISEAFSLMWKIRLSCSSFNEMKFGSVKLRSIAISSFSYDVTFHVKLRLEILNDSYIIQSFEGLMYKSKYD
jgi:hypothetical protein